MEEKDMLEKFGGRKFVYTILLQGMFFYLTASGMMDVKEFLVYSTALFGGYGALNLGAKAMVK